MDQLKKPKVSSLGWKFQLVFLLHHNVIMNADSTFPARITNGVDLLGPHANNAISFDSREDYFSAEELLSALAANHTVMYSHFRYKTHPDLISNEYDGCVSPSKFPKTLRTNKNFGSTNLLVLDFDKVDITAEEIKKKYLSTGLVFFHETRSSRIVSAKNPDGIHRWRVALQLEEDLYVEEDQPVEQAIARYHAAAEIFIKRDGADPACKDPIRLFYGMRKDDPIWEITQPDRLLELPEYSTIGAKHRKVFNDPKDTTPNVSFSNLSDRGKVILLKVIQSRLSELSSYTSDRDNSQSRYRTLWNVSCFLGNLHPLVDMNSALRLVHQSIARNSAWSDWDKDIDEVFVSGWSYGESRESEFYPISYFQRG